VLEKEGFKMAPKRVNCIGRTSRTTTVVLLLTVQQI